jgi:hypothetical protein
MNWSDYEAVWKRQPLPRGAEADLAELKQSFEAKRRQMAAAFLVRDWLELAACGFMVVVYARFWQKVGPGGWPMGVAILMILLVAGVFIRERLRSRRHQPGAAASLLAKISADLAELRHQRGLLLRVWLWYIAPCAVAMLMHMSVIVRRTRPWDPLREPVSLGLIVIFIGLLCWVVWIINRRAVRSRIEPRIAELEKLQEETKAAP